MALFSYNFTQEINTDRLSRAIQQDANITIALDHIDTVGTDVTVYFKAELSSDEQTELSSIVSSTSAEPIEPEPQPVRLFNNKVSQAQALMVDISSTVGLAGAQSVTINSHDFSDRTAWYQRSVQVTSETLTDSGDGLTFTSAHPNWVNIDNLRLTYDYKLVPERDGSFTDRSFRRTVVTVDSVQLNDITSPATPGYTINYADGTITFGSSQSGKTVTATYWHNDGVARRSEWILNPPPGTFYSLSYIEMQFSIGVTFTSPVHIEVWAGADIGTYDDFNNTMYDAGYGQNKSIYRGAVDLLNICTNRSSQIIPAFGGLSQDTIIFPFDYLIQARIRSDQGALIMLCLENDTAYTGSEVATATFYCQLVPITSL